MDKHRLLENHLQFLSTHRGIRKTTPDAEYINSDKPSFNIAFPLTVKAINSIEPGFRLYIPDWISDQEIFDVKRDKLFDLTYMVLPELEINWKASDSFTIKKADSIDDIEDFSVVQGKGFTSTDAEYDQWYNWMRVFNLQNLNNRSQHFYTAYENSKPVGVCLSAIHDKCAGIYAVATLPEFRKKGISTKVMLHALQDALKTGIDTITLQVATDSYAHLFYRKLGFIDAFKCSVYDSIAQ